MKPRPRRETPAFPLMERKLLCLKMKRARRGKRGVAATHGVNFADIDTVKPKISDLIKAILPPSPVAKTGQKGETLFYRADFPSRHFDIGGERVLDWLGHGTQTVLPPSIHERTGQPYRWIGFKHLPDLSPEELPIVTDDNMAELIAALEKLGYREPAPVQPRGGDDSDNPFRALNNEALANLDAWVPRLCLPRCRRVAQGYRAVAWWRPSYTGRPLEQRGLNLKIHPKGIRDFHESRSYTPIDLVIEACGLRGDNQRAFMMLSDWLGRVPGPDFIQFDRKIDLVDGERLNGSGDAAAGEARPVFDPWEKFIAPVFPFDVLPPVVADFVASQSDVIGCDPSALAMACLATFSGALDHRITLKIMEHGNWQASPRFWLLLVGAPSTKKTPLINAALAPYRHHQDEVMAAHSDAMHQWEREFGALAKTKDAPPKPAPSQRFILNDTTVEKVGDIISRSGRGILVHAEELAGWIGSMERYASGGKTSDRAFWLRSFDGGSYNIDRINRGELFISNLSASIIGGIQPERLAELGGLTSDGLLQRFIPVMMKNSQFNKDRPAPTTRYDNLVADLIKCMPVMAYINSAIYEPVRLTPSALVAMDRIRERLYEIEQNSESIAAGFPAFLGKLAGLAGTITLILHMVGDPQNSGGQAVPVWTVENAGRIVFEFILPHALEFYQNAQGKSAGEKLRKIAAWILTSKQSTIAVRDFVRCVSSMKGMGTLDVNRAVAPLVAAGWLKPKEPGLLCGKWGVPPSVFTQMAERAEMERKRTKTLGKLMNAKWAR